MDDGRGGVVVAVLTYRRPEMLARLLPELVRQARAVGAEILVVDNDTEPSARELVERFGPDGVRYVHEPRPGIAAARNAALAATTVDTMVFIDDDETPDPDWLGTMLDAYRSLGGAAVVGPVLRVHEVEPAAWVRAARVFDRRRRPTGTPVEAAGTGNLLVDLRHVRRHGITFDDTLGLSGGSDHLFTRRIRLTGGAIHWCDEAIVRETVPRDRLTGRWTLRRGYRSGSTSVRVDLLLADTRLGASRVRGRAVVTGLARVVAGGGRALVGGVLRRPEHVGGGAWTASRGAGMVAAAFGHRFVEYRRSGEVSVSSGSGPARADRAREHAGPPVSGPGRRA